MPSVPSLQACLQLLVAYCTVSKKYSMQEKRARESQNEDKGCTPTIMTWERHWFPLSPLLTAASIDKLEVGFYLKNVSWECDLEM